MTAPAMQVVVAGGGVFGVAAALELRRRGHAVTLLDAGPVPRPEASSSDISKAVRMDYGPDALYTELAERALAVWDRWNREWARPPYHQDGFLLLSGAPLEQGGFEHDCLRLLTARGHTLERLGASDLGTRFPAWTPGCYPDGYLNPRAGWAESENVVRGLAAAARGAGVTIVERSGVARFVERGGRVRGAITTGGAELEADVVLLAAGAWTPSLLPELSDRMWPVAQPVLYFRPADPRPFRAPSFPVWAADIANTGWYGFPVNGDGLVKVSNHGAGRSVDPDAPRTVDPAAEPRFREFLAGTIPALAAAPLDHAKTCLYCDAWDGNFWIDHHPERPGLFVAAGGSGHGFKFAPVIGGVIADRLEGRPNPFAERFRWRDRSDRRTEAARHLG